MKNCKIQIYFDGEEVGEPVYMSCQDDDSDQFICEMASDLTTFEVLND